MLLPTAKNTCPSLTLILVSVFVCGVYLNFSLILREVILELAEARAAVTLARVE